VLDWNEIFTQIPYLLTVVEVAIIAAVAFVLERVLTKQIRSFAKKKDMPPEVGNGIVLITRFLIILGAAASILNLGGLPTEWFVSLSALGGAAIGFASTRTIGNFIAGLYVLIARPFRVKDYVRINSIEGIVEEITINYTKVLTASGNVISIANQKIMDQTITNFRRTIKRSRLYCYTFEATFDHSLPSNKLEEIFDKVGERYLKELPKKLEYEAVKLTRLERTYRFFLYVKKPEQIFRLHPQILREIIVEWEKVKGS